MKKEHMETKCVGQKETYKRRINFEHPLFFLTKINFNLDGSDGLVGYWNDLQKKPELFNTRKTEDGSVMIATPFFYGLSKSFFTSENQYKSCYVNTLDSRLRPSVEN